MNVVGEQEGAEALADVSFDDKVQTFERKVVGGSTELGVQFLDVKREVGK